MDNLVKKLANKLSKEDLIELVDELTDEVNALSSDYDILVATNKDLRKQVNDISERESNAWGEHTKSQRRVAQLFGQFERIAHILNQTDDVDDVNDTQIIEQIVDVVENEIEIVGGEFVNHKGDKL